MSSDKPTSAAPAEKAPVIISASRSTDIPAFHAEWFIDRLKEGHVIWRNPFNQQEMQVSFRNCKVVIFWSKNPGPLIPYLRELDERDIHYYFQFTLNDYEKEGFEPNVPPLAERIETFKALSEQIGKEKVIWRFDPLIVTPQLSPQDLLIKIRNVGNQLKGYTDKLVFSFIDVKAYSRVQKNMVKATGLFNIDDVESAELSEQQVRETVEGLVEIRDRWKAEGWTVSLATCAEQVDLEQYGIEHNRCVDGDLMKRIFAEDEVLMNYLNYGILPDDNVMFLNELNPIKIEKLKDKGQRKLCGCMTSKDIGMYNTCEHGCVYCYANR